MLWNNLSLPFRFDQLMQITQIYLTDNNHDPSGLLARCCQSAKRAFSFVPHRLYKNDDIELLICKNFDDRVLESYRKLIPYAYKSDLARLCILFCHGGWYADVGLYFPFPAPKLDERINLVSFREEPRMTPSSSWSVANGLIYAKPRHPVVRRAIDLILSNVEANYYGLTPLCPTGPNVWGRALCDFGVQKNTFYGDFVDLTPLSQIRNRAMILPNGQILAFYKPNNSPDIRRNLQSLGAQGTNDFGDLWQQRNIYRTT